MASRDNNGHTRPGSGSGVGDNGDSTEFTVSSTDQDNYSDANSSPMRRGHHTATGGATGVATDRRALVHELQLAKIELSQRQSELEDLREQWRSREEDLTDRLAVIERENAQLKHQLQHELDQLKAEARRRNEHNRRCLDDALRKQHELEEANLQLIDKAGDIKRMLSGNLLITNERAIELQSKHDAQINVRDFVCLRVYETVQPVVKQIEELTARSQLLSSERDSLYSELEATRDCLLNEREVHAALQETHQKISAELAEVRTQVHSGNYKVAHFDEVQAERDRLREQLDEMHKSLLGVQSQLETVTRDRDQLKRDAASHQQASALLKQDCDYLAKQVSELSSRAAYAEERSQSIQKQLDEARAAKEAAVDRVLLERERSLAETEAKAQRELERLRLSSQAEVERLRQANVEFYETQLRANSEQRERAVAEAERSMAKQQEAEARLQELQAEFSALQASGSAQVNELQSDMRMKEFELDRCTLMLKETQAKLEEALLEQRRAEDKLGSAKSENQRLEQLMERQQSEHQIIVSGLNDRLQAYEAAESELDGVVLQAAEMGEEADAEQVVAAYGTGVTVPSTARRRMRQSVQLARRCLQLERQLRDANNEAERERQLGERRLAELERLETALKEADQPYSYLVDTLRTRDAELADLSESLSAAEAKMRGLVEERNRLAEAKNRMAADLERLIAQREELASLKQVVANMRMQSRRSVGVGVAAAAAAAAGNKQKSLEHVKPYGLHYS